MLAFSSALSVNMGRSIVHHSSSAASGQQQNAWREGVCMVSASPTRPAAAPVKKAATVRERQTKQPDMYRLYIYNDPINRRERVVDVLLKTCAGLTFSRAYAAMQEAHENGRGLVLVIAQEIAEHYCACINSGTSLYLTKTRKELNTQPEFCLLQST